jgi:hypothetical protein
MAGKKPLSLIMEEGRHILCSEKHSPNANHSIRSSEHPDSANAPPQIGVTDAKITIERSDEHIREALLPIRVTVHRYSKLKPA